MEMTRARRPANVQKMAAVYCRKIVRHHWSTENKNNKTRFESQGHAHVEIRQPPVAEGRDGITEERDGEEDEVDLPGLAGKDADARLRLKHVDAPDEEEGGAKVDGQGDGDVADKVEPAADPAGNATPVGGCEHECLVVHA